MASIFPIYPQGTNTGTNFTVGTTSIVTFKVSMGGTNIITLALPSITATQTNCPWNLNMTLITASTGASGTVEIAYTWNVKSTGGAGVSSSYIPSQTATSGAINLTATAAIVVTIAFSAANVNNIGTQREMVVSVLN